MDFEPGSLIASFLVSGVGFVAFSYGRSRRRLPQLVVGVTLMLFPYFVSSVPLMLIIAATLLALLGGAGRLGY